MILVDLNVILDVMQQREPQYRASAATLDHLLLQSEKAWIPAHAVTTIHYLVARYSTRQRADKSVEWLISNFSVASVGLAELRRAQTLKFKDFEDAIVVAAAESAGCTLIVTRNIEDFRHSSMPARTPEEFLLTLDDFIQ